MKPRCYISAVTLGFIMVLPTYLPAQVDLTEQQTNEERRLARTRYVSCFDEDGKRTGPRRVRSDLLVSPNRWHRAYVEVHLSENTGEADVPACTNLSAVYLSSRHQPFHLIYAELPMADKSGNGVELIDWTANSRYLLFSVMLWVYESHVWDFRLMLYDTNLGVLHSVDYNRAFGNHFQKECTVEVWGVGFISETELVIRAQDSIDLMYLELDFQEPGESPAEPSRCVREPGLWLLDWRESTLNALPNEYPVKRNGHLEPAP